jgi:hypothetical protein
MSLLVVKFPKTFFACSAARESDKLAVMEICQAAVRIEDY